MSAIIFRGKRSYFEELGGSVSSSSSSSASSASSGSPSAKRIRWWSPSSSSPVRFSPPRIGSGDLVEQLSLIFPGMDKEILEKALKECGDDLDSAIKSLNELRLESANNHFTTATDRPEVPLGAGDAQVQSHAQQNAPRHIGGEWVDLFVQEMASSTDMDDARARVMRALEQMEKSILAGAGGKHTSRKISC